ARPAERQVVVRLHQLHLSRLKPPNWTKESCMSKQRQAASAFVTCQSARSPATRVAGMGQGGTQFAGVWLKPGVRGHVRALARGDMSPRRESAGMFAAPQPWRRRIAALSRRDIWQ